MQALHSLCFLTLIECAAGVLGTTQLEGQIYAKFKNNVTMETQTNHNAYFTISVISKTTD